VHALPFLVALASAVLLAPALLRELSAAGRTRVNYRGRPLPFPFGVLVLAASLIALIALMLLERLASSELFHPEELPIAVYALGVLALGLVDDTLGERHGTPSSPRGWRGHGAAVVRGELSTGALKAAGSLGLALFAINLLDLRPGRTLKALVLLGAGLLIGSANQRPLWALGLFLGPALVAGFVDLRERAMLGDTGASLLGAVAGLWLVLSLSGTGQVVALALLAAITLYGELRSISELLERTPGLRELDSWGRPQ